MEYNDILDEIEAEVHRSTDLHGEQMHLPLGTSLIYAEAAQRAKESTELASRSNTVTWMHIAAEEVFECFAEEDPALVRAEAIQAAAMFVQIVRRCDLELQNASSETV
jgi:hypothetical protein